MTGPVQRYGHLAPGAAALVALVVMCGLVYSAMMARVTSGWAATPGGSTVLFAGAFLAFLLLGFPLYSALRRRLTHLFQVGDVLSEATLRALLAEMAVSSNLPQLMQRTLEVVGVEGGVERVSLFVRAQNAHTFLLTGSRGGSPPCDRLSAESSLIGVLHATQRELSRRSLEKHPRYENVRSSCLPVFDSLRADLLLPVQAQQQLVGVVALGGSRVRRFDASDMELLRTLAAEIGLCITRAHDAERMRKVRLDLDRFARFLPRAVAREVAEGRLPGEQSRRRRVTAVCCVLDGLASSLERLSADALAELVGTFHAAFADETAMRGGTLAEMHGGLILALYGDPEPIGDHAARGLQMAASLLERLGPSRAKWDPGRGGIVLRIGIDTGHAAVGFVAVRSHLQYQAVGPPVLTARTLARHAPANGILVAARTLGDSASLVRTETAPWEAPTELPGGTTSARRLIALTVPAVA